MPPPLVAPIFAVGHEPLPPGWTEDDRAEAMKLKKMEGFMTGTMESCVAKTAMSGVLGFGMGAFFSLAGSSFGAETAYLTPGGVVKQQTAREVAREMGKGLWRSGRGFGKVGALYAGVECVIESYRAKNDMTNAVAAGFVTGGLLARSAGPKAALGGAMGFAAFSAAIDLFMRRETADDD